MRTISLILTFFISMLFCACNKENIDIKEGIYQGTFTVTYHSSTQTGQTTLELKNGKFSCSGNSNRIPAGGSGTYSFDDNKVTFADENFWTAEFDWNLILNGQYAYTFDGEKLIISANKNDVGHYKYDLTKQ